MYTIIPFRYVDASYFKQYDEIAFEGELTQPEMASIAAKLIDERLFIPADLHLGIPELQKRMDGFPSADDHVFHELGLMDLRTQAEKPETGVLVNKDDFVAAFHRIRSINGWDLTAATVRLRAVTRPPIKI